MVDTQTQIQKKDNHDSFFSLSVKKQKKTGMTLQMTPSEGNNMSSRWRASTFGC